MRGQYDDVMVDESEACQFEKCDHRRCPAMLDVGGGVRCWGTAAHLKPGCRQGKHLAADPHIVLLLSGYCVFLRFFVWDARHGLRTTRGWG